mgnify:CR=1 FL=1
MCYDNTRTVHWRKEPYDIDIRRPAKWGNPFRIGEDGTRSEVIEKFRQWVISQPELMNDLEELRGKRLGCWCSPKPCHGDVLIDLLKEKDLNSMMEF